MRTDCISTSRRRTDVPDLWPLFANGLCWASKLGRFSAGTTEQANPNTAPNNASATHGSSLLNTNRFKCGVQPKTGWQGCDRSIHNSCCGTLLRCGSAPMPIEVSVTYDAKRGYIASPPYSWSLVAARSIRAPQSNSQTRPCQKLGTLLIAPKTADQCRLRKPITKSSLWTKRTLAATGAQNRTTSPFIDLAGAVSGAYQLRYRTHATLAGL